mmetsp:Transcript_27021/g.40895  ORF Transcript_27021/g.40895 Transcript_27021/m.40895 type:complete len:152 (-) Transcript_27021:169-624(-)
MVSHFFRGRKNQVNAIISDFEEKRRKKAELEAAERKRQEKREEQRRLKAAAEEAERKRKAEIEELRLKTEALKEDSRGKYIDYSIYENEYVDQNFDDNVISMSCGGRAIIMLHDNGGWSCSIGIPNLSYNKLNGRQRTLPSPTYVAIGSLD